MVILANSCTQLGYQESPAKSLSRRGIAQATKGWVPHILEADGVTEFKVGEAVFDLVRGVWKISDGVYQ